jgi:hypothetical protein
MIYVKFRNISGVEQTVLEAHGSVKIQPNHVFWGDAEALIGDPRFQRIKEILPNGNYDFTSWSREQIVKALFRMGVNVDQYRHSTGELISRIRLEYANQRRYFKENQKELTENFYESIGGVKTPPEEVQAKNPMPLPMDALKNEVNTQKKEIIAKNKKLIIHHNDAGVEPKEGLGERLTAKKEESEKELINANRQYVEERLENIKQQRKEAAAKKFDLRKLNIDMMVVFISKYTDLDWKEYDYVDYKWAAFEKIKELGRTGEVEGYEQLLEDEYNAYKQREGLAPKKWTGATKDELLVILEAMGHEVTEEYEKLAKRTLMGKVKAFHEIYKRNGLGVDDRKYYYEYGDDGKPIDKTKSEEPKQEEDKSSV